jgi:hypothetical protein
MHCTSQPRPSQYEVIERAAWHLDPTTQSLVLIIDEFGSYHLQISGRVAIDIQHPVMSDRVIALVPFAGNDTVDRSCTVPSVIRPELARGSTSTMSCEGEREDVSCVSA